MSYSTNSQTGSVTAFVAFSPSSLNNFDHARSPESMSIITSDNCIASTTSVQTIMMDEWDGSNCNDMEIDIDHDEDNVDSMEIDWIAGEDLECDPEIHPMQIDYSLDLEDIPSIDDEGFLPYEVGSLPSSPFVLSDLESEGGLTHYF